MLYSIQLQVVKIEDELSAIGENQKQLEISEEKARRREEKYQVAILNIFEKGKKRKEKRRRGEKYQVAILKSFEKGRKKDKGA